MQAGLFLRGPFGKTLLSGQRRISMTSIDHLATEHLHALSKEELIAHICRLQAQVAPNIDETTEYDVSYLSPNILLTVLHRAEKRGRVFDMRNYSQKRIAFKLAYLGWNYHGFASQPQVTEKGLSTTIEEKIFEVLKKLRFVDDMTSCGYSKCGRTDKGVSAMCQVVSLTVRSAKPLNSEDDVADFSEIDYIGKINAGLPSDIRFYAWADIDEDFSARFSCSSRRYRYYFRTDIGLNLDYMQEAANYLVGEHDFRNFCKFDPSKQITNYRRRIFHAKITRHSDTMSYLDLQGTAFLWHQVRCIMSILFLVGHRFEAPNITQTLLDIDRVPRKPSYEMASDLPLVLYDCTYDDIQWHTPSDYAFYSTWPTAWNEYYKITLQQLLSGLTLDTLSHHFPPTTPSTHAGVFDGRSQAKAARSYIPLLQRHSSEDVFVAASKWLKSKT